MAPMPRYGDCQILRGPSISQTHNLPSDDQTPPFKAHQSIFDGTPISFHWLLRHPVAGTGHYSSISLIDRDSKDAPQSSTLRSRCRCREQQQSAACAVVASVLCFLRHWIGYTQISEPAGALPFASGRAQGRAGGSRATPSQREMQLESKVRQMEEKMAMSRSIMRKLYHANVR